MWCCLFSEGVKIVTFFLAGNKDDDSKVDREDRIEWICDPNDTLSNARFDMGDTLFEDNGTSYDNEWSITIWKWQSQLTSTSNVQPWTNTVHWRLAESNFDASQKGCVAYDSHHLLIYRAIW
jgi:hypothetical protein